MPPGDVYSLVASFGVFVTSSVFKEDKANWKAVLEQYWQSDEDHADKTIKIGHSELYYTTAGCVQIIDNCSKEMDWVWHK